MNYYNLLYSVALSAFFAFSPACAMDVSTLGETSQVAPLTWQEYSKQYPQPFLSEKTHKAYYKRYIDEFPSASKLPTAGSSAIQEYPEYTPTLPQADLLGQSIRIGDDEDEKKDEGSHNIFEFRKAINSLLRLTQDDTKKPVLINSDEYKNTLIFLEKIKEDPFVGRAISQKAVIEQFINKKLPLAQSNIKAVKNTLLTTYFEYRPGQVCAQLQLILPTLQDRKNKNVNMDDFITCLEYRQTPFKTLKNQISQTVGLFANKEDTELPTFLEKICQNEDKTFAEAGYNAISNLKLLGLAAENKEIMVLLVVTDINTMLDFVSHNYAFSVKRKSELEEIKKEITNKKTSYTQEKIADWTTTIQALLEETQRPSMGGSTIGVEEKKEQIKKEKRQQNLSAQEQLEDAKNNWSNAAEDQIIYLNARNWDIKTKTYILQLLWLNALESSNTTSMALFRKQLENLQQKTPSFIHNKGSLKGTPLLISTRIIIPADADQKLKNFIKEQQQKLGPNAPRIIAEHNYREQKQLLTTKNQKKQAITLNEWKKYKDVLEEYSLFVQENVKLREHIKKAIENTKNTIARLEKKLNLQKILNAQVQQLKNPENTNIIDLGTYQTNLELYKNTLTNKKEKEAIDKTLLDVSDRIRRLRKKNNIIAKITNEDIQQIKAAVKAKGFQSLLDSEHYKNFPDKNSVICLSELIALLKNVNAQFYENKIARLNAILEEANHVHKLSLDDKIILQSKITETCTKINDSLINQVIANIKSSIENVKSLSQEEIEQLQYQVSDLLSLKKYTLNDDQSDELLTLSFDISEALEAINKKSLAHITPLAEKRPTTNDLYINKIAIQNTAQMPSQEYTSPVAPQTLTSTQKVSIKGQQLVVGSTALTEDPIQNPVVAIKPQLPPTVVELQQQEKNKITNAINAIQESLSQESSDEDTKVIFNNIIIIAQKIESLDQSDRQKMINIGKDKNFLQTFIHNIENQEKFGRNFKTFATACKTIHKQISEFPVPKTPSQAIATEPIKEVHVASPTNIQIIEFPNVPTPKVPSSIPTQKPISNILKQIPTARISQPIEPQSNIQPQEPTAPQPEQPTWTWWNPISWITATTSWIVNSINNLFNWVMGR